MRRLLPLAALLLSGCTEQKKGPEFFRVDPATASAVEGVVRFEGKLPKPTLVSMDAEKQCEDLHGTAVHDGRAEVSKTGALKNVFVYIRSGLEGKVFEPPGEQVVLDQRGCMFVPRVLAVQTGQTLRVKNSDPVSHNVHPQPRNNREWNGHQPPQAPDLQRRFMRPEVLIPVKCNIHSWMRAYIAAVDHPFFAVSDEEGRFSWPQVPPGTYVIQAWHELFGETSQQITLKSGSKQALEFTFRHKQ